ncbi:MAG: site-specific integrase [Nitriliruptoraceae bacterium]|nr:site-specific integrase [Nitriliruptoraceae bacterium]
MRRPASTPVAIADLRDHLYGLGLSPKTIELYSSKVRSWLHWCGRHGVDPVNPSRLHVRTWAETYSTTYPSQAMCRRSLSHWFAFVGQGEPLHEGVRMPAKPRMQTRALSPEDASMLVRTAMLIGGRRGTATLCGLYLAARRSEIAGLRWSGWREGRFRFERTKSKDVHEVPVHPVLATQLEAYRETSTSAYLFPGDRGRPHVGPSTVWEWIRETGETAGLKVTTHQLRHTALTTALESSRDLAAVQLLAGHRDPMTTAGYTRISDQRVEDTVAGLDYFTDGGSR